MICTKYRYPKRFHSLRIEIFVILMVIVSTILGMDDMLGAVYTYPLKCEVVLGKDMQSTKPIVI
jgi:hypothetical protein